MTTPDTDDGVELLRTTLRQFLEAAEKAGMVVSKEHFKNAEKGMSQENRQLYHMGRRARFVLAQTGDAR